MSFEEKNLPDYESRIYEVADEDSTIFSAPELHRDKVKKGVNTKRIAISSVALLLVAALVVTVIIYIPKKLADQPMNDILNLRIFQSKFDELKSDVSRDEGATDEGYNDALMEKYISGFDRVILTREDAEIEFVFAEFEKKSTDDEGNETVKKVKQWRLKEIDPSLTDYTNIDNTVRSYFEQTYTKKISDNKNDGNNYGFDKPTYKVDFYKKGSDEVDFSLLIGAENPSKTGRYATATDDDAVYYIAGVSEFYHYQKVLTDFAVPETIPAIAKDADYSDSYYTDGQLIMCNKLILKGKTFGGEYIIENQEADNVTTFTSYVVKSPTERPANDENVGNIVALFSYGITGDGCYSYSVDEEELKKFGFDDPDFDVTIVVDNITRSFKAVKQEDGAYAVYYEGNKTIMQVSAGNLSPAAYERGDLFNELMFIENITNAQSLKVESGAASVEFKIENKYDEETENYNLETIKVGGKTVEKTNFQNYYQYLVSISAVSYEEHSTKGMEPTTVVTLTHSGGKTKTVVKYFQITTARYQVEVNGTPMGLISSSEHGRIMKYAQNLANGKEYNAR